MPFYIAIGIDFDYAMQSNPKALEPYVDAYKLKRKMDDERDWYMGAYILNAFSVTLPNAFSKNSNAEYLKEPFLKNWGVQEDKDNTESNELLAVAEFTKFAEIMKVQGLPNTNVLESLDKE